MDTNKSIGIGIGVGILIILFLVALAYILYLRYRLKSSIALRISDLERNGTAAAGAPASPEPKPSEKVPIVPKSQAARKPPFKAQFSNPLVSSSSMDADMGQSQSRKTSKASETSVNNKPVLDVTLQDEAGYITMVGEAPKQDVKKEPIYQNLGDPHYGNLPHGAHSGYTAGQVGREPSPEQYIYEMVPDVGPFLASN